MRNDASKREGAGLASYMAQELTPERERKLWAAVDAELERRRVARSGSDKRRALWAVPATVALVAAAAAMFYLWSQPRAPSALEGAALVTGADELDVSLVDGSVVEVAPRSHVRVTSASAAHVRLDLTAGRVSCDVTKDAERDFEVLANGVKVRVIGTKFSVENQREVGRVFVLVERGVVEVTTPDGSSRRLGAGESWQYGAVPHGDRSTESGPLSIRSPALGGAEQGTAASGVESEGAETSVSPSARGADASRKRVPNVESDGDLFFQAMQARQRGATAEAARLFGDFASQNPQDPRSGAAWFELGRLRMDRAGDPRGAEQALSRAVAAGAGPLTDDALARLVRVRASLGMMDECRSARAVYLRRFPSGVHIDQVRRSCPD